MAALGLGTVSASGVALAWDASVVTALWGAACLALALGLLHRIAAPRPR